MEAERRLSAGALCGARTQPIGTGVQMHLLELETTGQFERGMNRSPQNIRQLAETGQNQIDERLPSDTANTILPL